MRKILVMTDLHLTKGGEKIINLDPAARLTQGLAHAAKAHPDADQLVLTGDLTHHGQTAAYETLKDALESAPWPVSFLMGNHDKRETFLGVFPEAPVDPAGFIQSSVDLGEVRLLTLDTLDETAQIEHAGWLCEARLNWLEGELRAACETPCILFMHHPPFKSGFRGMDDIRLLNDSAFAEVIQKGNVAHIIAGHIHRTITASVSGVPATIFKSTCHQMPMMLGVEGSSHSVDEPGAYGILLVDDGKVVVHFEDFTLPKQAVGST